MSVLKTKCLQFLLFSEFSQNGSPGQTTMPTRSASKFCVEPQSPFSGISHKESKTIGKPSNIVFWPECRPEFPNDDNGDDDDDDDDGGDDDDDDDAPTIVPSGQILFHSAQG